ncbi:keratin-associated protein 13-1-like [Leptonychotes weddellii]|uniref:Keratin-associated protein n=1 Tax=Leptonychotes weddellii TaxID=9713 RepID=A0A2U3Z340_LEPWE|nr:keratin-associated protein 13-1-like [Leptonychotes weddellii]
MSVVIGLRNPRLEERGDIRTSPHCHSAELTSLANTSYSCCSGNYSSRSFGAYLRSPSSSCRSSCPSNLVYHTDLCSPSTCQLGSSLSSGCQETCCEPTSCQTSHVVSSPLQTSCYHQRTSMLCDPCRSIYPGSLGCGSSRNYCLDCGSLGFRPLGNGICGFPFLGYGSRFCRLTYLASRSCQTSRCQPTCRSG